MSVQYGARRSSSAVHWSQKSSRSHRSSAGYPESAISGATTSLAPAARAASIARRMRSALPAKSPTVTLTWATAIFMGSFYQVPDVRILDSLDSIDPARWDVLAGGNPTLAHAFLDSLHASGCAGEATGWAPRYLTLWDGEGLEGAVPLYVKSHSRDEYVFDWAWADAYERHGLEYYPKLLAAVPFTPATGARLLAADDGVRERLARALLQTARATDVSSLHVLFPTEADARALRAAGMLERSGVQFHWRNAGYATFEEFLGALSHDKRKKIRQERRRVAEARVSLRRATGREATTADWDFFTQCYRRTFRRHRSAAYLHREFFRMLAARKPGNGVPVGGGRGGRAGGAGMGLFGGGAVLGR